MKAQPVVGKWPIEIGSTFHGARIVGADYEYKTIELDWSSPETDGTEQLQVFDCLLQSAESNYQRMTKAEAERDELLDMLVEIKRETVKCTESPVTEIGCYEYAWEDPKHDEQCNECWRRNIMGKVRDQTREGESRE